MAANSGERILDDKTKEIQQQNSTDNASEIDNKGQELTEQPVREITQTDHLNKRLLSAFLGQLNNVGPGADNSEQDDTVDAWEEDTAKNMARQVGRVFVIGISGTTNSGKTTISRRIIQEVPNAGTVNQDFYFLPPGDPRLAPIYLPELNHHNWEDYRALEMDKMVDDIKMLISNFHQSTCDKNLFIFVDGFSIFGWRPLASLFDLKYYLSVEKELCAERRLTRNYNPPDVPGYFEQIVWPEHLNYLNLIKEQDDIVYMKSDESIEDKVQRIVSDIDRIQKSSTIQS